jgi:myo-inositol-1(or 4)-monophosphatase
MVREAGGYVTDLDGQDAMFTKGDVLAGNAAVHAELLKLLKKAAQA